MKRPNPLPLYMSAREYTWGIRYWLFHIFFLPYLLAIVFELLWPGYPQVLKTFFMYLINFAVLVPLLHNFLHQAITHFGRNWWKILAVAAIGFVVYSLTNTGLGALIKHFFPDFYNINDANITKSAQGNLLLIAMGTVAFIPTAEELMYRGLIYGLCRKRSRVLAFAVSALIFAAIHVTGYIGNYQPLHLLLCYVQYLPAGLILAGAYEISGNIFAPILIHTVVNLIGILSVR